MKFDDYIKRGGGGGRESKACTVSYITLITVCLQSMERILKKN